MITDNCLNQPNQTVIWLKRLARLSAWALLAGVIVLLFSGWGITQTGVIYNITFGLVDRGTANTLHRMTNIPLAFFFLLHVLVNIKLRLAGSRPLYAWLTNGILLVVGAGIMGIVIYLELFRLGG